VHAAARPDADEVPRVEDPRPGEPDERRRDERADCEERNEATGTRAACERDATAEHACAEDQWSRLVQAARVRLRARKERPVARQHLMQAERPDEREAVVAVLEREHRDPGRKGNEARTDRNAELPAGRRAPGPHQDEADGQQEEVVRERAGCRYEREQNGLPSSRRLDDGERCEDESNGEERMQLVRAQLASVEDELVAECDREPCERARPERQQSPCKHDGRCGERCARERRHDAHVLHRHA
jgi:hypothetical protein